MKFGAKRKNYIGMTHSLIRTMNLCKSRILITNTFRRTSNTIGYRPQR